MNYRINFNHLIDITSENILPTEIEIKNLNSLCEYIKNINNILQNYLTPYTRNLTNKYLFHSKCNCSQSFCDFKSNFSKINIKILYKVTGKDHTGYCSDAEGEEFESYKCEKNGIMDKKDYLIYLHCKNNKSLKHISKYIQNKLNHTYPECTSGGSGYCYDSYRDFVCIKFNAI